MNVLTFLAHDLLLFVIVQIAEQSFSSSVSVKLLLFIIIVSGT